MGWCRKLITEVMSALDEDSGWCRKLITEVMSALDEDSGWCRKLITEVMSAPAKDSGPVPQAHCGPLSVLNKNSAKQRTNRRAVGSLA